MLPSVLAAACSISPARAIEWATPLTVAMAEWHIDTSVRQAAFLAQITHESGGFRFLREIWGPTLVQMGYEHRADLGNTQPGDGSRFRGRGLIQVTGRANYAACGAALGLDLLLHPEQMETPLLAARSAGWFWFSHRCNNFADLGDFVGLTKRINGGTNGLGKRVALWRQARTALGLA